MSLKVKQKVFEAQEAIKNNDLKKAGFNEYSNFKYYTPEQVSQLIDTACRPLRLLNEFDLIKEENGNLAGILTITDLESGEQDTRRMPVEIPTIKATNAIQQLGGAMTYAKRYLLQNVYDIADNSIDPDANQRPKNNNAQRPKTKPKTENSAGKFSIDDFKKMNEQKKEHYLIDLIIKKQSSRIPAALSYCEEHKYLSNLSIKYIQILDHIYNLTKSERADYIISCINDKSIFVLINKIMNFTSYYKLLDQTIIKDLNNYINVQYK